MPTCGNMIDEVVAQLHGWGAVQDRITGLSATIAATDMQFTVDATFGQSVGITPGIVQIDSEQIYITGADPATGICTIAAFGRGYGGTTAVAHTAGAPVTSRPVFPRFRVFQQINEIIGAVGGQLFATSQATYTANTLSDTYALPDEARNVIDASVQQTGTGDWVRVRRWRRDPFDNALRIGDRLYGGQPIRVVYATDPGTFTGESDDFEDTTGLPLSTLDIFTIGTVARLIPGTDISRVQQTSVEQSDRSRVVPPNAGLTISKYLMGLYADRLTAESRSLRARYPIKIVKGF